MPSYCYECRDCKAEFSLIISEHQEFDAADVFCVACEKEDVILLAFSMSEDLALVSLSARITDLELRMKELEGRPLELDS